MMNRLKLIIELIIGVLLLALNIIIAELVFEIGENVIIFNDYTVKIIVKIFLVLIITVLDYTYWNDFLKDGN
ncbi:MAG: hypothetical protein ACOCRK_11980 [bacterium]